MDIHDLTPGEMADRSGVAISALHFYEREGLIASRRCPEDGDKGLAHHRGYEQEE